MQSSSDPIAYSEHALDILAHALTLADSGERFALVVSLEIEGGTARSIGSLAVVTETEQMTGYLSNGCIDRDIILQCSQALNQGHVKLVRYGAGSQYMDIRLPCGGALDILIDPDPDLILLRQAYDALAQRQNAWLCFSPTLGLVSSQHDDETKCFEYAPKPALVLVGRGAILRATAKLAQQMDFDLRVASPDKEDLDALAALEPTQTDHMRHLNHELDINVDAHTAVVVLFHDHEWEQNVLISCVQNNPFFIGAMGSSKTHALRVENLMKNGLAAEQCDKIHGPIGLVPSLRNASLIAVSALADVVAALPASQFEQ